MHYTYTSSKSINNVRCFLIFFWEYLKNKKRRTDVRLMLMAEKRNKLVRNCFNNSAWSFDIIREYYFFDITFITYVIN